LPIGQQRLDSRAWLAHRAGTSSAAASSRPLPQGADIVTSLVRVLFDHDDAHALAILRAVRAALPRGGTLLVAEPMAGVPGAQAMGDAYFGLYLLAMGAAGRAGRTS
jgi:demethylspheroidene O-methyltransferase